MGIFLHIDKKLVGNIFETLRVKLFFYLINLTIMKTVWKNPKTFLVLLASTLITGSVLTSCDKDEIDDNNQTYTLSGNASGSKEVPSNASTGTATLTGTFDTRTNSLTYSISWSGLSNSATVAHFHGPASETQTADPLLDIVIATNGVNGTAGGTVTVSDALEAALVSGKLYYNIHTVLYPAGEIRSQVTTIQQ